MANRNDDLKGELVPEDVSPRDLRAEANLRSFRAGYPVTRDGRRPPRKVQGLFSCPWGRERFNVWPRDEGGELIGD